MIKHDDIIRKIQENLNTLSKSEKKVAEAKEVIEIGKPFFLQENDSYLREYDTEYKKTYNKIMN